MAGVEPNVRFENGVLTIQGERKLEKEDRKKNYHRVGLSYGAFNRSFSLPRQHRRKDFAGGAASRALRRWGAHRIGALSPSRGRRRVKVMTAYDSTSFSAGRDSGMRVAACVARLAALELTDQSRWWNRWRRRLQSRALVACAEEMECAADEGGWRYAAEREGESIVRPALVGDGK